MHLRIGQTKNYSESGRVSELAVINTTDKNFDTVVAIPERFLAQRNDIRQAGLPFVIRVKQFHANSSLSTNAMTGFEHTGATAGAGANLWWRREPHETATDRRDAPSALVEIVTPQGSLGTWLVSDWLEQPQTFTFNNRTYALQLRLKRFYLPFSLQLLEFERREVLIYMNNPLRYEGKTFYQAGFDPDDQGTILQVVKNPGWLTPYLACGLVATGMVVQFLSHLIPFLRRRRTT